MAFGGSVGVRRRDFSAEHVHVSVFFAHQLLGPIVDFPTRMVVII